jgi:hypothetical protein
MTELDILEMDRERFVGMLCFVVNMRAFACLS